MTTRKQPLREEIQTLENEIREKQAQAQRLYVNPTDHRFPQSRLATAQGHTALSDAAKISRQVNRKRAKVYNVAANENPEHAETYRQHAEIHNAQADINRNEVKAHRLLASAYRVLAEVERHRERVVKMQVEVKNQNAQNQSQAPDPFDS